VYICGLTAAQVAAYLILCLASSFFCIDFSVHEFPTSISSSNEPRALLIFAPIRIIFLFLTESFRSCLHMDHTENKFCGILTQRTSSIPRALTIRGRGTSSSCYVQPQRHQPKNKADDDTVKMRVRETETINNQTTGGTRKCMHRRGGICNHGNAR